MAQANHPQREPEPTSVTLNGPDDFNIHLRRGDSLSLLVEHAAIQSERVMVSADTQPPIVSVADAEKYYLEILEHVPHGHSLEPLMSLLLTDDTLKSDIADAAKSPIVFSFQLSADAFRSGLRSDKLCELLKEMERTDLVLRVRGDYADIDDDDAEVGMFETERRFVRDGLPFLLSAFPSLRVVLDAISTKAAVDFVVAHYAHKKKKEKATAPRFAATITAHHLLADRSALFRGGRLNPHSFCVPPLNSSADRSALSEAALSGLPFFFAGSDSAPHSRQTKEAQRGRPGVYSAFHSVALYAEAFHRARAMPKLNDFLSRFGADFYGTARNQNRVRLTLSRQTTPMQFGFVDGDALVPFQSGAATAWALQRQIDFEYALRPFGGEGVLTADCDDAETAKARHKQTFRTLTTRFDATTNVSKMPMLALGIARRRRRLCATASSTRCASVSGTSTWRRRPSARSRSERASRRRSTAVHCAAPSFL